VFLLYIAIQNFLFFVLYLLYLMLIYYNFIIKIYIFKDILLEIYY